MIYFTMATQTFDPNTYQGKLGSLQNQAATLQSSLDKSNTAYTPNVTPTTSDVSADTKLTGVQNAIDQLNAQKISNDWYGPASTATADSAPSEGFISKGLNALGKPLDAVVGAAQWATGTGAKSDLFGDINENLNNHARFGSILNKKGVPSWISLPLGFAMDIAADPINWATAGSSALVPRVGEGLVKGAIRGGISEGLDAAKTGLISNLEKKAVTILPGAESRVGKFLTGGGDTYKNFIDTLGEKAVIGSQKYDQQIGTNVYDRLGKNYFGASDLNAVDPITGQRTPKTLGSFVERTIRSKIPKGDDIVESFKYSPDTRNQVVAMKDALHVLSGDQGLIMTKDISGKNVIKNISSIYDKDNPASLNKQILDHLDEVAKGSNIEIPKVADTFDNAKAIFEISGQDLSLQRLANLEKAYEPVSRSKTGIQWYDSMTGKMRKLTTNDITNKMGLSGVVDKVPGYNKVKDLKPIEGFFNGYQAFTDLFKWAKVPADLRSFPTSAIGNYGMGWMEGMPVTSKKYGQNVLEAFNFLRGGSGKQYVLDTFFNDFNSYGDFLMNHPDAFRSVMGMSVSDLSSAERPLADPSKLDFKQMKSYLNSYWDEIEKGLEQSIQEESKNKRSLLSTIIRPSHKAEDSAIQTIQKLKKEGGMVSAETPSGLSSEFMDSDWFNKIKQKAAKNKTSGMTAWALDKILNAMPDAYSHMDQAFKLGSTKTLTHTGVNEAALIKMSRFVPITKDDLLEPYREGGELLYRLKPQKAAEVASDAYMNYAAMPSAVKMLRSLPVVGLPFGSYSYAMLNKVGKTLVHNPAAFTKVQSFLNEINGQRTPEEKKALEDQFNAYIKSPGMLRLSKTMNMDVTNMIPWLSMNMLMPSQRRYGDTYGDKFAQFMDNTPFMKDPFGQVAWDYMIQPMLLSEGEQPQGQFGQPLYPVGASLGQKTALMARTGLESVVPGVAAMAGLPAGLAGLSNEASQFVPSYKFRTLVNAVQGKDALGAVSKEDPWKRGGRAILSQLGIPLHPLNLQFTSKQVNKTNP